MSDLGSNGPSLPELPSDWEWKQLDSVLESLETGKRPKGGVADIQSGVPSIGGEHLRPDGTISLEDCRYIPSDFYTKLKKGKIKQGDVLVVKDGATTGKTSFVDDNFLPKEAAVNEHVFICRAGKQINERFLFHFLWSSDGQRQIQDNIRGAAQGGITREFASKTFVPVAPPDIQVRLVEEIDRRKEEISALEAELDEVEKLQTQFRQALLRDAFSGRLTHDGDLPDPDAVDQEGRPALPAGWEWKRLEDISVPVKIQHKIKRSTYAAEGLFPIVDQGDGLIAGYTDDKGLLIDGDAPFVVFGDHTRRVKLITTRFAAGADGIKVMKARDEVLAQWLGGVLSVAPIKNRGYARHFSLLQDLWYPVPPIDTQEQIIGHLADHRLLDERIGQEILFLRNMIDHVKASLLHQAFTGQLIK